MNLLYVIFTYNREKILGECLRTLFVDNKTRPDRCIIIDDGSRLDVKQSLLNFSVENSPFFPIDLVSIGKNGGYGAAFELGMSLAEYYQPSKCFFLEQDYVFAKGGIDTVTEVFDTDIGKHTLWISGYNNPDFYDLEKTSKTFPRIIVEDGYEDNLNREIMYKPFDFQLKDKKIKLQFVSNSCGTSYWNFDLLQQIKREFPNAYNYWKDRSVDKHKEKRLVNDGNFSHGSSSLYVNFAKLQKWDLNKYAAGLDILPSVANHINGGLNGDSINGGIVPEGSSFVSSPTWGKTFEEL